MTHSRRLLVIVASIAALLLSAMPAVARHRQDPHTDNLRPTGHTRDNRPVESFADPFFTDAAFWGTTAYQGTWSGGFRTIDISDPDQIDVLSEVRCGEFQGDVGVYGDLVFRSIDFPVDATTPEETCTAPLAEGGGFEGIQIFRVDDPARASADDIIAAVATDCGSHTHTVVPDLDHNRVLLYVSNSGESPTYPRTPWGNRCREQHGKFQIVEVPLDAPEDAALIRNVKLGPQDGPAVANSCHDIAALVGTRREFAVCAGDVATVHDIRNPARPRFVRSFTHRAVTGWHSAALSWDGRVTVLGWEPGGGVAPECEAGDPDLFKSVFFFNTFTGRLLGRWVLPRPQSAVENCTIHNYNVVPTHERDVLVLGNYQAGTWVVNFTDPRRPRTVAWSDPPPLDPQNLTLGGAWGSYWYNDAIYETNITEGLNVFRLRARATAHARHLPYLNPQTQVAWWRS